MAERESSVLSECLAQKVRHVLLLLLFGSKSKACDLSIIIIIFKNRFLVLKNKDKKILLKLILFNCSRGFFGLNNFLF